MSRSRAASCSEAERAARNWSQALEQKTKEAAEANEKYLRTYADFDNYRKRMQRDMADFRKYANEQLVLELLTVVDNLGLALKHAAEAGEAVAGAAAGRGTGVQAAARHPGEVRGEAVLSRRRAVRPGKA